MNKQKCKKNHFVLPMSVCVHVREIPLTKRRKMPDLHEFPMFSEPQRFHKKTRCKTVLYSITSPAPVNTHSLLILFSLNSDHYILHPLQSGLEQIGH